MVSLFILLAPAAALWASGCKEEGGEEDTVIDTSPDPQEEDPAAEPDPQEEEQGEEEAVEDLPPDLPLDLPSEVPDGPENCPPPPYGVTIGDIIQPHEFISVDDTMISLCDYYQDTSLKLLLIYATAGWCSACAYESQTLPSFYNEYHGQGFQILAAVFEDAGGNPATRSYAQNYANTYAFPFPTVVDNTFQLGIYFDKAATPMNMFVDLTTMEILDIQVGFDDVGMPDTIEYYLSTITR